MVNEEQPQFLEDRVERPSDLVFVRWRKDGKVLSAAIRVLRVPALGEFVGFRHADGDEVTQVVIVGFRATYGAEIIGVLAPTAHDEGVSAALDGR